MNSICVKLLCCTTEQWQKIYTFGVVFIANWWERKRAHLPALAGFGCTLHLFLSQSKSCCTPSPSSSRVFSLHSSCSSQSRHKDSARPGLACLWIKSRSLCLQPTDWRLPFDTHSCGQAASQHSSSSDQYTFAVTNPVPAAATQTAREISTTAAQKPFPPIDNSSLNGNLL